MLPSWLAVYYAEPIEIERGEGRYVWDGDGQPLPRLLRRHPDHDDRARAARGDQGRRRAGRADHPLLHPVPEPADGGAGGADRLGVRHPGRQGLPDHERHRGQRCGTAAGLVAAPVEPDPGTAQQLPRPLVLDDRASPATGTGRPTSLSPFQTTTCTAASSTARRSPGCPTASTSRPAWPTCARCSDQSGGDIAALIAEPIQGVGGFTSRPDGLFGAFAEVLREHGILLISDEVQTGWGRTGEHFWGWQAHGDHAGHRDVRQGCRQRTLHGWRDRAGVHHGHAAGQLDLHVRRLAADQRRRAGQPALPARARPAGQRAPGTARRCWPGCARSTRRSWATCAGRG